jgi:hypothetical protein
VDILVDGMTFWLIKSGKPDMWNYWTDDEVISVGWDVGPHVDKSWNDLRSRIMDKFDKDTNWAGNAVGSVKSLAGTHRDSGQQMSSDDVAIIIGTKSVYGHSVVRGVVEVGEYEFDKEGVAPSGDHTYTREIDKWLYGNPSSDAPDEGPIPKTRLGDQFQQGGDNSLHIASTIKRSKFHDTDTLETLVEQLREAEAVEEPEYDLKVNSERAVEEYLLENIGRLDDRIDTGSIHQQQFLTEESRVDLYCYDQETSDPIVVELKKGEAGVGAYDQLSRYLNAEREKGKDVTGLLVAESFSPSVTQKAAENPHIQLRQIKIDLRFESVSN